MFLYIFEFWTIRYLEFKPVETKIVGNRLIKDTHWKKCILDTFKVSSDSLENIFAANILL